LQTLQIPALKLELQLHPSHAVYIPAYNLLLIADLHIGKANHFQKNGIAVPSGSDLETLNKLSRLIEAVNPGRLWILGDLFHSKHNAAFDKIIAFREQFNEIEFGLIHGNHDILEDRLYANANIPSLGKKQNLENLTFTHEPIANESGFQIYGHIHPAIMLSGKAKQRMWRPCFWIGQRHLCLPSFGAFTGGARINPGKKDIIYVSTGDEVYKVYPQTN
jgi:DNA ligase-associated metallophosphoesterase